MRLKKKTIFFFSVCVCVQWDKNPRAKEKGAKRVKGKSGKKKLKEEEEERFLGKFKEVTS